MITQWNRNKRWRGKVIRGAPVHHVHSYVRIENVVEVGHDSPSFLHCVVFSGKWLLRVKYGDTIEFSAPSPVLCKPKRVTVIK